VTAVGLSSVAVTYPSGKWIVDVRRYRQCRTSEAIGTSIRSSSKFKLYCIEYDRIKACPETQSLLLRTLAQVVFSDASYLVAPSIAVKSMTAV